MSYGFELDGDVAHFPLVILV